MAVYPRSRTRHASRPTSMGSNPGANFLASSTRGNPRVSPAATSTPRVGRYTHHLSWLTSALRGSSRPSAAARCANARGFCRLRTNAGENTAGSGAKPCV